MSSLFNVNSSIGSSVIEVDPDGNTVIKNLVLLDEKTGNKWSIKVSDGELVIEPWELKDKREIKLKNLLND
jgi:pyruvate kinase